MHWSTLSHVRTSSYKRSLADRTCYSICSLAYAPTPSDNKRILESAQYRVVVLFKPRSEHVAHAARTFSPHFCVQLASVLVQSDDITDFREAPFATGAIILQSSCAVACVAPQPYPCWVHLVRIPESTTDRRLSFATYAEGRLFVSFVAGQLGICVRSSLVDLSTVIPASTLMCRLVPTA